MDTFILAARELLEHTKDDSKPKSEPTCPIEKDGGPTIVPFIGNLRYHQFATILSGACAILSTIIVCTLVATHAFNYSNPVQQRQIIRILLLIPWVALFSFLVVWRDDAGEYLAPSLDFGCAIALSSFLLFMCDLVLSHRTGFDDMFGEGAQAKGTQDGKSPFQLKRVWYSVLQFIPMSILIWVAQTASLAAGTYCKRSNNVHFAHIWLAILKGYTTTVAILFSIAFYKKFETTLRKHYILLKLATFKGVIGLSFLQSFIISILSGHGVLKPTKYMTYHDVDTGLSSLILACEMPIFAILLVFAFPPTSYKGRGGAAAGPLSAIVDAFNVTDLLSAFVRGPMRLVRDQQRQILRQNGMRIHLVVSEGSDMENGRR